jgi:hypothetical protein
MKATRVVLFLSPVLLLLPALLPVSSSLGLTMLGVFYGSLLRRFPWNLMMAGLCYVYANQLGREGFRWAIGSFVFPFLAPLILAFMPPMSDSIAENRRRAHAVPPPAKGAAGSFETRFPLLERFLAGKPEAICAEGRTRFTPVPANYEFSLRVDPSVLDGVLAEATERKFTTWANPDQRGTQVFGAGVVQPENIDTMAAWLRKASVPGEKLMVAWRQNDGRLKFFEYYP